MIQAFRSDRIQDYLVLPRYRVVRETLFLVTNLIIAFVNYFYAFSYYSDLFNDSSYTRFKIQIGFLLMFIFLLPIYVNLHILIPRYLLKNRLAAYLLFLSGMTLLTLITVGTIQIALRIRVELIQQSSLLIALNIVSSIIMFGFLMAGSTTLKLLQHWLIYRKRIDALERLTIQSELSQLKNQINPHFLFNMLNNANTQVRENPVEATLTLSKLYDLLEYQLNDSLAERVRLADDIHFLTDFLNLEKIRRDNFTFTVSTEGEIESVCLPPLLFIPFVENAVKHNNDNQILSYVHLYFKVEGKRLTFVCVNSKPTSRKIAPESSGIGLANIKRRLELLYEKNHELVIEESEITYSIKLYLTL
ncbi:sensor histidine kinase [Parabacteroides sp.]